MKPPNHGLPVSITGNSGLVFAEGHLLIPVPSQGREDADANLMVLVDGVPYPVFTTDRIEVLY